jgi:hypothetical protein
MNMYTNNFFVCILIFCFHWLPYGGGGPLGLWGYPMADSGYKNNKREKKCISQFHKCNIIFLLKNLWDIS